MNLDFLQIGFQKCATTFLENNVYPYNPGIHCIQAANNVDLERSLLRSLILPDGLEFSQKLANDSISKTCSNLFSDETVNGIMFESFTFSYQRRFDRKSVIDRINDTFPGVKVITFVRNQKTWLLSHYSQYVKSGGLLSLHDFIECFISNPYMESHHIDWYPLISYLHEVFGKERVLVCLYEDLKGSPQDVADQIFSFLGVQSTKINPDVVNPSLSRYGLGLKRMLNHFLRSDNGESSYTFRRDPYESQPSFYSRLKHKVIYKAYKPITHRMCYKFDQVLRLRKKVELNDTQIQRIYDRYSESNEKLSKLLNVDLSGYGYPLPRSQAPEVPGQRNVAAPIQSEAVGLVPRLLNKGFQFESADEVVQLLQSD